MSSASRPLAKGAVWPVLALLAATGFSGCFGDDDASASGTTETTPPTESTAPTNTTPLPTDPPELVPEAHYHHYWGDPPADSMLIFDGTVTLNFDGCTDTDIEQEPPCFGPSPHIGSVRFDLESDGDNVPGGTTDPHPNGHADVVFTGASHIQVDFSWADQFVGSELLFFYKAANSPIFITEGIPVSHDDPTVIIPLRSGMADPAHQIWVSRWEFMLVADSGPTDDWQFPFYLSSGDVDVDMVAINGGRSSIDPPHPDPWAGREVITYGQVTGGFSVTGAAVSNEPVNQRIDQGTGYEGIEMPLKAIVPAGTQTLRVKAFVNATQAGLPEEVDWGLKWHGADTNVYTLAAQYTDDAGARVYELVMDDSLVDPPYEKASFFRFGFYPITADQAEIGTYEGSYAMSFEVVKLPGFTFLP